MLPKLVCASVRLSARQYFAGTLSAIARDLRTGHLESVGRSAAGNARASVKNVCASAELAVFTHISFVRDSSHQCN